jgi:hypothetical protein
MKVVGHLHHPTDCFIQLQDPYTYPHVKCTYILCNFFTNIAVSCNCNIYNKQIKNSHPDSYLEMQSPSNNFAILYSKH